MGSVADILRSAADAHGEVVAMRVDGSDDSLTYAELDARTNRWARMLIALGLEPGDRVAVALDNDHGTAYLSSYFAVHKAGCVFVALSTRAPVQQWRGQLGHSGAKVVIAAGELSERARQVDEVRVIDVVELVRGSRELEGDDPGIEVADDDLAEIVYTSGTTASPKGVEVTHGSITAFDVSPLRARLAARRFLHPLPLCTFAGTSYMLWCVRVAMTNLLMVTFDPARFVDLLEGEEVTSTYAVSSMWLLVLRTVPGLKERRFSKLRSLQFGAAPMPPSAVVELCETFPAAQVMNIYGLTEGGTAGCVMPPGEARQRPASVGRPTPGTEVRICGDADEVLGCDEVGEIWLRAMASKPRRYHQDHAATEAAWSDDGWLRTGDVGYRDADGYIYLVDRKKDLIIRGGHNIASLEVEDALYQHPCVAQAAVVGVPHEVLGEDVVAFVSFKDGQQVEAAVLRQFLLERLSDYKVPRRYDIVSSLPRNPLGKVLKRELREIAKRSQE